MIRFLVPLTYGVLSALPVAADTRQAVFDHIMPRYATFAQSAQSLAEVSAQDCLVKGMLPQYHAAYDAWVSVSHIQFGPVEQRSSAPALSYWPDPKDRTGKAIARLIAEGAAPLADPDEFKEVSIAAQGFPALERLLTEDQPDPDAACVLRRAIATFIAKTADDLNKDWQSGFGADFAKSETQAYQTPEETRRALYTALSTSLAFLHDQRLGRPLGSFDKPRPTRAEARRSERSQRHIILSLSALDDLTRTAFADVTTPQLQSAFNEAIARAEALNDPALAGVADPAKRFKVEVLQRAVRDVQEAVAKQIAGALGITAGFNALDGD
ncbi:imelysin family protein [Sulfitobacter sp. M57]|uniref:imelysin family protein n=1 Tax=unclassified Sulfitobacter TaxID=196795 RepID=UPI0023E2EC80|nr:MULTISPECIES: imelysin family protein [unclassified Sulfitobacter]MDF3414981.1 imelysin family protein [Sulfitobacter sp. KE5]MDF3422462.1 imelysin family protein [Sulfitobacter sp. KE43]MDF3433527.1 imelysin family protein [Sulfitobacter sp. KE42]MDF3459167.1 imelysin family protein [Sulfitobacter sp. S74]MDF3463066.1 imelysin family protein [Sulfitobacter sp. Ks18]